MFYSEAQYCQIPTLYTISAIEGIIVADNVGVIEPQSDYIVSFPSIGDQLDNDEVQFIVPQVAYRQPAKHFNEFNPVKLIRSGSSTLSVIADCENLFSFQLKSRFKEYYSYLRKCNIKRIVEGGRYNNNNKNNNKE